MLIISGYTRYCNNKYIVFATGQRSVCEHFLAAGTLIIVLSPLHFYELFTSDKYINLARDPFFWICSGLLFFYSCGFPLFALNNFLSSSSNIFIKNYTSIISLLNILLYSSFIIASLCRIRIRNSFF